MTGGSDRENPGDDSRGRLLGKPWFVVGLALAVAATLALVLADDIRYLRLGIVAALWAALVGAFLAVRYRKQAVGTEDAVAKAQEVYELELEREVAARREYELEVENDIRAKVHADSRGELDALRAEVSALRDNLQSLFGGEVLLERLSLTAQATRMRALREEQRIVETGPNGHRTPAQLTAAPERHQERPSEVVDRVREKPPARPAGRPAAPEPRRPERSLDLPPRRVAKSEPVRPGRGSNAAANVAKAAAEARAQQTAVNPQVRAKQEPSPRFAGSSEATRPGFTPSDLRRRPPEPADEPTQLSQPVDADWTASWNSPLAKDEEVAPAVPVPKPEPKPRFDDSRPRMEPVQPRRAAEASRPRMEPVPPRPEPAESRFELSRPRMEPVPPRPPVQPEPAESRFGLSRPNVEPVPPPAEELPPPVNPTLPEEVRRLAQEGRGGGRRRRAEDEPEQPSAGRRRRPDGEPPTWEALSPDQPTGSHARPEPPPRRAAPDDGGSHSAGRSVSDLLAAHGTTTDAIPRRRRRADG
ncbi:DUF6779 domain-containing protein [Amycolatopsis alkalitolerans]|uniref:DUF6779 domain-containing protein n=1 Tax=Amycolatopsis alkalitolerans TaxID=2547244 RepID=A0A5C4M4F1_9PSEU|nr:DUF6779 domain-containing protein [Amycolatopsis alkalitolerans]TNC27978.1 hypothetical protein FG385_05955 [Amycolatopsis alkalitolerans]